LLGRAKRHEKDGHISVADFDVFNTFYNSLVLKSYDRSSNDANSAAFSSPRKSVEILQEELAELRRELGLSFQ
jgi:hypothetical protein